MKEIPDFSVETVREVGCSTSALRETSICSAPLAESPARATVEKRATDSNTARAIVFIKAPPVEMREVRMSEIKIRVVIRESSLEFHFSFYHNPNSFVKIKDDENEKTLDRN
jgi:hypothetical protein